MEGLTISNKKGFTLIEAIIIVAVVSVFLSALLPFIVENLTANARSKKRLMAYEAAYSKMEELRSQDFDTISDTAFVVTGIDGASGQIDISDIDLNGDGLAESDILAAKVEITYPEKGETRNITLNTLITRDGVIENE